MMKNDVGSMVVPARKPDDDGLLLCVMQRTKSRLAREDDGDYDAGTTRRRSNIPYVNNRPNNIMQCTEQEFLEDYCKFCSSQMGRRVTPDNWPDAVLNGLPLDVFHLYKEVVTRGGYRYASPMRGLPPENRSELARILKYQKA